MLWSIPNWSYNSGVIHDGLAYLVERELKVIELATGKEVQTVKRLEVRSHHLVSLAGGRLFWTDGGGADWLVLRLPTARCVPHWEQRTFWPGGASKSTRLS